MISATVASRLHTVEYLNNAADFNFFDELVAKIRALAREGDAIEDRIPDRRIPYAWRRAADLHNRLQRRERDNPLPFEDIHVSPAAEAAWSTYIAQRAELLELARRGGIDDDLAEYLGMQRGDLLNPVLRGPGGGRRAGWFDRAGRIDEALGTLERLTPAQINAVPQIMAARRAEAAAKALTHRFSEFEEARAHG